jgi:hypothetical protein
MPNNIASQYPFILQEHFAKTCSYGPDLGKRIGAKFKIRIGRHRIDAITQPHQK